MFGVYRASIFTGLEWNWKNIKKRSVSIDEVLDIAEFIVCGYISAQHWIAGELHEAYEISPDVVPTWNKEEAEAYHRALWNGFAGFFQPLWNLNFLAVLRFVFVHTESLLLCCIEDIIAQITHSG